MEFKSHVEDVLFFFFNAVLSTLLENGKPRPVGNTEIQQASK
jgi:hypothetical protein